MAVDNASSNNSCPQWSMDAAEAIQFISSMIISPGYFVIGIFVHAVSLKAYCTEVKMETGYLYQIFLTVTRISTAIFSPLFTFSIYLTASNSAGAMLFRSYWCIWITVKIWLLGTGASYVAANLFSLLVGIDRVYALWKPMSYQIAYTKRNNPLTAFLLASISVAACSSNLFKYNIVQANGTSDVVMYDWVPNLEFMTSTLGSALSILPTVIECATLIGLYFCNVAVVCMYRRSRLKVKEFLNNSSEMKKREAIEKLLTLLAISQAICFTISNTYAFAVILLSIFPIYYGCIGAVNGSLLMSVLMIFDLLDFVFVFIVNKRFRRMILATVCCSNSQVAPTPVVSIGQSKK